MNNCKNGVFIPLSFSDSSGHVHQWHVPTGKSLNQSIEKRQTLAAAYSSDSSTYATSGSDCKLMIYDTLSGQNISTLEARYGAAGKG